MQNIHSSFCKNQIRANFSQAASTYNSAAHVQSEVAIELAQFIKPHLVNSCQVIEIGVGTGLLLAQILKILPAGTRYLASDLSSNMVNLARSSFKRRGVHFIVQDGEYPCFSCNSETIVISSMTFQWFINFIESVKQLVNLPVRELFFSLPLQGSFEEWNSTCRELGVISSINTFPSLSDVQIASCSRNLEWKITDYSESPSLQALKKIKEVGAQTSFKAQHLLPLRTIIAHLQAKKRQISYKIGLFRVY